jgi:hypothetical protein
MIFRKVGRGGAKTAPRQLAVWQKKKTAHEFQFRHDKSAEKLPDNLHMC